MATKRRRNIATPDTHLVEIYEDLAHQDEEIRLKAAHALLSRFAHPGSVPVGKLQTIISRLFRGLCSGRKAARLGFSIALTEILAQTFNCSTSSEDFVLTHGFILNTLYEQTLGDGSASGQDERDHYFGRLFGAEAVVKSGILFKPKPDLLSWRALVQFICRLALKKPWLRQECGWLLWTSISYLRSANVDAEFALLLIETLKANNLVRTPEAVAVWLELKRYYPGATLPKKIWKHSDPLRKAEMASLAEVMRDAKAKQQPEEAELAQSQGAAVWSQQLHFSWEVLLRELYHPADGSEKDSRRRMSLSGFWTTIVDQNLFLPSSSPERKHWGFLLLAKVVATAPPEFLEHVFQANTMQCLTHHLKGDERYLHRSASKAMQVLQARASQESSVIAPTIKGLLLGSSGIYNFDAATKTKTISKLLTVADMATYQAIMPAFANAIEQPQSIDSNEADTKRRAFADFLVTIWGQMWSGPSQQSEEKLADAPIALDLLISLAYFDRSPVSGGERFQPLPSPECRSYVRTRLKSYLNQSCQRDPSGSRLLRFTAARIKAAQDLLGRENGPVEFDSGVQTIVDTAWGKLSKLEKNMAPAKAASTDSKFAEVIQVLYCLAILQLYDEDSDAPEILQELNLLESDGWRRTSGRSENENSESILEILLSFTSKPSRIFHQACLQAFRTIASRVSRSGLLSLIRVLETNETSTGIRGVFDLQQNADEPSSDVVEQHQKGQRASLHISGSDSDSEMLDSDVDELSMGSSPSEKDSDSENDQVELEAFDAKLAAALGTRTAQEDIEAGSEESGEDMYEEDMPDEELAILDEKIAAVFRARRPIAEKRQVRKETKEAIINFKRRVLDLVEIYFKQDQLSPLALDLVLPLITTARKTSNKEIRSRAHDVLQAFCSKCKGNKVPHISGSEIAVDDVLSHLKAVHTEAGLDFARAHANACSKASLLLVKTLLNAKVDIGHAVDIYGETRKLQLREKKFLIQPMFFTEWNNWCTSARDQTSS